MTAEANRRIDNHSIFSPLFSLDFVLTAEISKGRKWFGCVDAIWDFVILLIG